MRWAVAVVASALMVVAAGCAGGGGDELIRALPHLVPGPDDVRAEFPEAPGEFSVEQAGREGEEGYRVWYNIGPPQAGRHCCLEVRAAVELHRDDASAQGALEQRPDYATGDPLPIPRIGDASIAWPMATVDGAPACPCDLRFRVGRIVATVGVSYGGPPRLLRGPDQHGLALAELMASRMRQALGDAGETPAPSDPAPSD